MERVPASSDHAVGAAWALSVLSALSSLAFAIAAVAGWTMHLWPATPVTLGIAAGIVIAGPLAAALLLHAIRVESPAAAPSAPAPVPVPVRNLAAPAAPHPAAAQPRRMTPEQAFGHALMEWRDRPLERERA